MNFFFVCDVVCFGCDFFEFEGILFMLTVNFDSVFFDSSISYLKEEFLVRRYDHLCELILYGYS